MPDRGGRRGHRLARHRGRRDGGRARIRAAGSAGGGTGATQDATWPAAPRWRCWSASRSPCWSPRSACSPGRPSAGSRSTSLRELEEVDFIFQVGPLSFIVALFAGAAGMLSLVSAKSAALVGVFISVTTVPAAGFAVVAATVGDWDIAAKSAAQLAINLSGIVLAGRAGAVGARGSRPTPLARGRLSARCGPGPVVMGSAMGIKVALEHRTSYTFDRLVEVYPHVVRLRPAPHSRTPIEAYSLPVEPGRPLHQLAAGRIRQFPGPVGLSRTARSLTITVG